MRDPNDDRKKRRGIAASNADFVRYDHVRKEQRYLLAERDGAERFDDESVIRTCDIGPALVGGEAEKLAFARELGRALEEIGFAILIGHGIDPALVADVERTARAMFTERSLAEKLRFRAARHGSVNQGYFPIRETSDIHPDLVEGWVFCRRAFDVPGRTPSDVAAPLATFWPDVRDEVPMRRLVEANERLVLPIMQAMLRYLGSDPHAYDERLTRPNIGLRLNYYPPLSDRDLESGAGRLLGHEDVGMFVLLPAPTVEGLQVLNRRNMRWVRLDAPPGSIILNTGDYVQRITNDRFPSTTHRVSRPRDPALMGQERLSFPMNVYVWEDEVLEVLPGLGPPRYEPIKALEFHTRSTSKFYGDDYAVTE